MSAPHVGRIEKLRTGLAARGLDAVIVQNRINTRYLTGFTCSYSILVVDKQEAIFITDARYGEAAGQALSFLKVLVQPTKDVQEFLAKWFKARGYSRVGFEGSITVDEFDGVKKWTRGAKLEKAEELITRLRIVKDDAELKIIRKAVRLADIMMENAFDRLKPGVTESEISRAIRFSAEELGGEGESFANIVASGPNSSRPHHHPGSRKLKKGDVVTVDLGGIVEGYCSDLTRNASLGAPPAKYQEIYDVCLRANEDAIRAIRPGMTGVEVDRIARSVIAQAGYGEYFGHGLGHGVGLEIHESPRLSLRAGDYKLEPGNIVTVEPGIYLPGEFGVRIEDYVLVTEKGCQVLSKSPKQLKVV